MEYRTAYLSAEVSNFEWIHLGPNPLSMPRSSTENLGGRCGYSLCSFLARNCVCFLRSLLPTQSVLSIPAQWFHGIPLQSRSLRSCCVALLFWRAPELPFPPVPA